MAARKWRFAGLQAAGELTLIDGERRKDEVVFGAMKTVSREHTGRGAADQKFVMYLRESSPVKKKLPSQFPFEILGNEKCDSQRCKVYCSGGNFSFRDLVLEISTVKVGSGWYFARRFTGRKCGGGGGCRKRNQNNAASVLLFFVTESEVDISIWLCSQSFSPREL